MITRRLWQLARAAAAVLAALALAGAGFLWTSTPSGNDLPARVATTAAAQGVPVLAPGEVPPVLAEAMVAIEDERFYSHHGVDSIGLARALWVDVSQLCACEGGSTITQQLVNLAYYPGVSRIGRKLPGLAVAFKVETHLTKPEILAAYLSIAPTGQGLSGAQAAACAYFGHDLAHLTLAEAAEIAGMPQAPSSYDPRFHPDQAQARRAQVLDKMVELGMVDSAAAHAAETEPVLAARTGCA